MNKRCKDVSDVFRMIFLWYILKLYLLIGFLDKFDFKF